MQPCTVYRERELVRRREEKKKGEEERENSGFFLKRVELVCARLFWEWCLGCLYSTIYLLQLSQNIPRSMLLLININKGLVF